MKTYMIPKGCKVVPYQRRNIDANNKGKVVCVYGYISASSEVTTVIDWYFNEKDIEYKEISFSLDGNGNVNNTYIKLHNIQDECIHGFQVRSFLIQSIFDI